jgi:hypothetical protein
MVAFADLPQSVFLPLFSKKILHPWYAFIDVRHFSQYGL